MLQLNFRSISEKLPGDKWLDLFNTHWPAYKAWFQSKGAVNHPDLKTCIANLERYMPEMMPTYHRLCNLTDNDPIAARFLTGFQPPAYISGCSQAVWEQTPMLVRNYDYHPHLSEGTLMQSAWNGTKVIATGDCLSGVVDGMNEHGLVASLTFGGRKVVGKGFGIPFILRYVLEFCSNVEEGVRALCRIPSHMAYNVMLLDKTSSFKMVQLSPDHAPVITDMPVSTNHQSKIDWPEHAKFSKTVEREKFLLEQLAMPQQNSHGIADAFLQSPLFNRRYNDGFGTIYTAVYKPLEGSVELRWPEQTLHQSFADFKEVTINITYTEKIQVPLPVYNEPAYAEVSTPASYEDANYWVDYGKSWANGNHSQLAGQVAKTIVDSLGLADKIDINKLVEKFTTDDKCRGQIPWEMLADVWANIGNYYKNEN